VTHRDDFVDISTFELFEELSGELRRDLLRLGLLRKLAFFWALRLGWGLLSDRLRLRFLHDDVGVGRRLFARFWCHFWYNVVVDDFLLGFRLLLMLVLGRVHFLVHFVWGFRKISLRFLI
jgi:hypothetical protein